MSTIYPTPPPFYPNYMPPYQNNPFPVPDPRGMVSTGYPPINTYEPLPPYQSPPPRSNPIPDPRSVQEPNEWTQAVGHKTLQPVLDPKSTKKWIVAIACLVCFTCACLFLSGVIVLVDVANSALSSARRVVGLGSMGVAVVCSVLTVTGCLKILNSSPREDQDKPLREQFPYPQQNFTQHKNSLEGFGAYPTKGGETPVRLTLDAYDSNW